MISGRDTGVRSAHWPFDEDSRFTGRRVSTFSRAYSRWTHFLDYRSSSYNEPAQMSVLRASLRASGGQEVILGRYDFDEAEVWYAGAWSRVRSAHERAAAEFTTGPVPGLPGTPTEPQPDPAGFAQAPDFVDGTTMTTVAGYNIHHFVYEHLTSAWIHRDAFDRRPDVLIGASDLSANAFQGPLLRLLGLQVRPVLLPLHSRVRLRECTMLGSLTFRLYAPAVLEEIRLRVSDAAVRDPRARDVLASDVVYLGRGDTERNRRPLVNEDEVIALLRQQWPELTVIRSALQPVEQTVAALRRARVIIGPTAGALVHYLWARDLEHLIELVPDEYPGVSETEEVSDIFGFTHHGVPTRTVRAAAQERLVDTGQEADLTALAAAISSVASS